MRIKIRDYFQLVLLKNKELSCAVRIQPFKFQVCFEVEVPYRLISKLVIKNFTPYH